MCDHDDVNRRWVDAHCIFFCFNHSRIHSLTKEIALVIFVSRVSCARPPGPPGGHLGAKGALLSCVVMDGHCAVVLQYPGSQSLSTASAPIDALLPSTSTLASSSLTPFESPSRLVNWNPSSSWHHPSLHQRISQKLGEIYQEYVLKSIGDPAFPRLRIKFSLLD